MNKVELKIVALSHSVTKSHNYAVVLGEMHGDRRLPIVIGGFEAQAIAVALESMSPNRPLTHDLFKNTLEAFNIEIKEIIINNLVDGIFYAQLVCQSLTGEEITIDSRTSDAIALAVRFGAPVFTYEFILDQAGVILDDDKSGGEIKKPSTAKKSSQSEKDKPYSSYTTSALNKLLEEVLSEENYEKAALIRDEINKREGE